MSASAVGWPISRKRLISETSTTPFSTETPKSVMNPTPAVIEKVRPRTSRARIPPEAASRTLPKIISPILIELNVL